MEDVHVDLAPPSAPVFVKGSGRRGVVFHWIGRLTGACAVLYLAILVLGFVGVSWVPPAHFPLAGSILPAPAPAPRLVDNVVEIQAPPRAKVPAAQVPSPSADPSAPTTTEPRSPATTPAQRGKPAATATTVASAATSQTVTPPARPVTPPSQSPRVTSPSTAVTTTTTSSPTAATTHTVPPTAASPTHRTTPARAESATTSDTRSTRL